VQFREYLEEEKRLELELLESIYQEDPGWIADESVMDILRGTGRVIKGVAQTGSGIMSMGDEALSRAVGDGTKGRFKGGWDRFARGVGNIGSGVKQAVVGDPASAPATSKSPVTPTPAAPKAPSTPAPVSKTPVQAGQKKRPLELRVAKQEKVESGLESLINQYRAAQGGGERNRILAVIAMRYPKWYQEKLKDARNRQFARGLATS
jgi:hypothetical protein